MKKIFAFAVGAMSALSMAATDVVWSVDEETTKEPAYFFPFDYGKTASVDGGMADGVLTMNFYVKPASATVATGAGYGFGWKQNAAYEDVAISLASYKGVCMTYTAEAPFRVDFKQSNITDDNYYGSEIAASATPKKTFVAFADLKQGWKSATKTVAWSVASQLGVQFGYKDTHVKTSSLNNNTVEISKFVLADECPSFAPVVKDASPVSDGSTIDIAEGAVYEIDMSEVFEDADGDDLAITVKIESASKSVVLVDSTKYNQNSVVKFTTAQNPKGDAVVTITATDPVKKTASLSFTFATSDVPNAPVAKDFAFEVLEDSSYKNSLSNRLTSFGSDADGDKILLELVSEPQHGTLDLNTSTGLFTYVPEKDFYGKDAFTYRFVEEENSESVSNIATANITVVNVNDVPVVKVLTAAFIDNAGEERAFKDTLVADEDFASFVVMLPKVNVSITDADGDSDYKVSAKTSGVVTAAVVDDGENYLIEVSAKKDSNGVAKVTLAVTDPKITITNDLFFVKVNPVPDAPIAKDDSYEVAQDSLNSIDAKSGVLANDMNPDGKSVLTAVLEVEPEHGTVVLAEDGSFTYESEAGYEGPDAFAYKTVNEAGLESDMAVVTLTVLHKNHAPVVVEGVLDTVGNRLETLLEDFSTAIKYTRAEVQSWFTDDQDAATALTYTVRSDDSLLAPSITAGVISIKSVKNACGEASVIVTAKDKNGASTDMLIPALIECVNDKPVSLGADTIRVKTAPEWTTSADLNTFIGDVDGDTLEFSVSVPSAVAKKIDAAVEGSILTISSKEGVTYADGDVFIIAVKGSDASTYLSVSVYIKLTGSTTAIHTVAAPKASWKTAITATRGSVAIFDMQGRVLWHKALPASEAEVKAIMQKNAGNAILRVNGQQWMFNGKVQ